MSRLVDIYPYYKDKNKPKLLIFKRAKGAMYSGQWRMIGGKVNKGEKATEAALRELKEETNLEPTLFWVLPSINQFYDHTTDTIKQIPAFAAEVNPNIEILLNHEHSDYTWISAEDLNEYILWPEQKRLMNLLSNIVTNNQIIEEWII